MPLSVVAALSDAERLCVLCAGIFMMSGLLTGIWKWRLMATLDNFISKNQKEKDNSTKLLQQCNASTKYVDLAHRASFMYSFAALLVGKFSTLNDFSDATNYHACGAQLLFFGLAIGSYLLHGFLGDTQNQIARPGSLFLEVLTPVFMVLLICGEVGGFAVLFYGFLDAAKYL